MCISLRCADIFNFVMRHRVWTTHHLCKNSLDFKLLLEIGNSEYDIGIDGKIARPKLSLDSESAWRQLQRPTNPRQPFIIFFPLQHQRRCHHRYCHHLRSAYKIIFWGLNVSSLQDNLIHISSYCLLYEYYFSQYSFIQRNQKGGDEIVVAVVFIRSPGHYHWGSLL